MARSPVRSDGRETLKRIMDSAKTLFSEKGFRGVSIPMVAKQSGIRTPSFYHYFTDKRELYNGVVAESLTICRQSVLNASVSFPGNPLKSFYDNYLRFVIERPQDFRIIKEASYFDEIVLSRHKKIIHEVIRNLQLRPLDKAAESILGLFIVAPVTWVGNHRSLSPECELNREKLLEDLVEFVLKGLDPGSHRTLNDAFEVTFQPLIVERKSTRSSLIEAAEELFGSQGFHDTYVSDITRRAGVASGTFYVHFKNKLAILEELIESTLRGLKRTVAAVISNYKDRRDAEIAGFKANLEYFRLHYNMCNIVMETEFTYPEVWKGYYRRIQEPWVRALSIAMEAGQIRRTDPSYLSLYLMGIGHYLTEELVIRRRGDSEDFSHALRTLAPLLYRGIDSLLRS